MTPKLNIRHLLIIALGYNEYLHEEIDRLYEKKRWDYYETFKKSNFYNDLIIKSFTAVREKKMREVAGIVEWSYTHNDLTLINQLIKKGYKDAFRYYQQNKHRLDIQDFSMYIYKRSKKELFELSETELTMQQIILAYLAFVDNNPVDNLFGTEYGQISFEGITHLITDIGHAYMIKEFLNDPKTDKKHLEEYIYSNLGVDFTKKYPDNIENLFDFVINKNIELKLLQKGITPEKTSIEEAQNTRKSLFNVGLTKHIGAYTSILKLTELNYNDLLFAPISKDDLLMLTHNALQRKEGNDFSEEEISQFFIASLYIHALVQQFKKQKETLIEDSAEAWYVDVKNREQQLNEKELFYEKMKINLESAANEEKTKAKELAKENEELRKELERLKTEVNSFKEDKEELVELRNFVYGQKKIDFESDELHVEEIAIELNKKKIVVCGGHPNMHRKLKEWIPELVTVDTDALGKNLSHLANYDVIYFYPNYANHSFYKKVKAAIKNSKTKFAYLQDVDNIEYIIFNMSESINV